MHALLKKRKVGRSQLFLKRDYKQKASKVYIYVDDPLSHYQVEHMRVGVRVTGTLPLPSSAVGRHSAAETGRDGVNISREDLDAAIKKVLSPGVQASAGRYRAFLADEESGVERACSALVSEMLL